MDYYGKANWIIYYLVLINLVSFLAFLIDKNKARKKEWRIPEKSLMTLAIIGGSIGSLVGMHVIRHKTQKILFRVGVPIILILQIILFCYLFL